MLKNLFNFFSKNKGELLFILSLILIVGLFIMPTFIRRDLGWDYIQQTVPWYQFLFLNLKQGIVPFWSPYSYLGAQFLFSPSLAVFHPLTILMMIADLLINHKSSVEATGSIIEFTIVLGIIIGSIGMYLFSRKVINVSRIASLFTALVFALNPLTLRDVHSMMVVYGVNLIPWMFLALYLFLVKPKFTTYLVVTITNFLIFAGGYPYYFVYFILAEVFLVLFYGVRKTFLFLIALLNSILLAGFFLLPYYLIYRNSSRGVATTNFIFHSFGSYFPARILNIPNPIDLSSNVNPNLIQSIFGGPDLSWGVFAFVFLIYGFFFLKNKPIYLWTIIIFFTTLFYSFGANLSSHIFFGTLLPIIYQFRSHDRILSLTIFSGAILIGIGVDAVLKRQRAKYVDIAFWTICLALFIGLTLGQVFFIDAIKNNIEIFRATIITLLFLFSSLIIKTLTTKYGLKIFLLLGIVIMLIEYNYYFQNFTGYFTDNFTYAQYYHSNALIPEPVSNNNLYRIYFSDDQFASNTSTLGLFNIYGYENTPNISTAELQEKYGLFRYFKLINLKYIVTTDGNISKEDPDLMKVKTIDPSNYPSEVFLSQVPGVKHYIYQLKNYLPRFFVPQKVEPCINYYCWLQEDAPKLMFAKGLAQPISNPSKGVSIEVKKYDTNSVVLNINTPKETFIASSENWDRGWKIKINGNYSIVYNTSDNLRGFIVPSGNSRVEMSYFPPFLNFSLLISVAGILMLIGVYILNPLDFVQKFKYGK